MEVGRAWTRTSTSTVLGILERGPRFDNILYCTSTLQPTRIDSSEYIYGLSVPYCVRVQLQRLRTHRQTHTHTDRQTDRQTHNFEQ